MNGSQEESVLLNDSIAYVCLCVRAGEIIRIECWACVQSCPI